jgi:hypothetical protein
VIEISEYQDKCLRQNIHANLFLGGGKGGSKTYAGCLLSSSARTPMRSSCD